MNPTDSRLSRPAVVGIEALTPVLSNGHAPPTPTLHGKVWKVAAVIPCFNRRSDLELLLGDLARQSLRGIDLWLTVVDNASTQPLSTIAVPAGLRAEFVRLEKNSGGSGGFNAGMSHVLSGAGLTGELGRPDFVWWLDSDARVSRRCLIELVRVLARRADLGAVGSALRDRTTGHTWEVGGNIVRRTGRIWPAAGGDLDRRRLVRADYLAACSALVRREAIERTGLFPDNFIYYDDVEWCLQMTRRTGLKVAAAPRSQAWHPPGVRRFVTWARYYTTRNCFAHVDLLGLGGRIRARCALGKVAQAVGQTVMGMPELGELHLRGLRDAAANHYPRLEPRELIGNPGFVPFSKLGEVIERETKAHRDAGRAGTLWVHPILRGRIPGLEALRPELRKLGYRFPKGDGYLRGRALDAHLRREFAGALWRAATGPNADVAVVATGWPTHWFRGRTLVQVTSEGILVRHVRPARSLWNGVKVFARGLGLAVRIWRRGPFVNVLPPAPVHIPRPGAGQAAQASPAPLPAGVG